jgi:hypothetical protein
MGENELKSPEDVRRHFRGLNPRRRQDEPSSQLRRVAYRVIWMLLLAGILLYYLISKLLQVASMPG